MEDLRRAIETSRQAVESTPGDDPSCAMYLNNLGNALWSQFNTTGSMEDLGSAIEATEKAVESTPEDHPDRTVRLKNSGTVLLS